VAAKVHILQDGGKVLRLINCPGCGYTHPLDERWTWNQDLDRPTFRPSLLCNPNTPEHRCHSFITDGQIKFLDDCHHALAGKTVDLPDWED
jgi:hypothetical protein